MWIEGRRSGIRRTARQRCVVPKNIYALANKRECFILYTYRPQHAWRNKPRRELNIWPKSPRSMEV